MRWQGRRESSNVEDRRGSSGGGFGGKGGGIVGLLIILVGAYLLLGQQKVAQTHFENLTIEQQDSFKLYPIYHFWTL